jgi:uncharacterized repeat protein (TIGR03803 family)
MFPSGDLLLLGNTLYGTAAYGGSADGGTVFALNADGTDFRTLHSFTTSDGKVPWAGLSSSGNILYGTTAHGGDLNLGNDFLGSGVVFALKTDGTGFTNLHIFTNEFYPYAGLILSDGTLYGTAREGGSSGYGVVFALNTDGTGFRVLHSFTALSPITNSDGTVLYTNRDGVNPQGALILSGNTLYGTTIYGGSFESGTVFKLNTDGTGFTTLYSFATQDSSGFNADGANPTGGLVLSGNVLYGTANSGGTGGSGTIFSIALPVSQRQLTITPAAGNVVLTWPTNFPGLTLQSATNLASPIWTTNLPAPLLANGQNTVTNPISGTQQFFRLSQ